jgi:hypothetical protein
MRAKLFAGIIAAAIAAAAGLSPAENAERLEPLGGAQSVKGLSDTRAGRSPLDTRLFVPQADFAPPATAPSGGPLPPHQLTPAPVLPFNPNRPLMPAPTAPSYAPNPGRAETRAYPAHPPDPARAETRAYPAHPPDPARAETRAYPGPLSGSGRAAR